jgi:serine protease Do
MSCRTVHLALLLIGANSLSGQDIPQKSALAQLSGSIRELTDRVSPAVVEVIVNGYGSGDDGGRVSNQISRRQSSGSGVVVDPSGYIITNAHVVQGAIDLKVLTQSTRSSSSESHQNLRPAPVDARVLGIDRESDLALLKIEAENLPVVPFGDSDKLRQGDLVLAIGSPLGFRNSVSMGVVSASGRAVSDDNPILYIQTDASINPGNSGGALIDHDGFLVGVNSFIVSQSGGNEGIGFAIPSNVVRNVYQQLKRKGRVSRGSIRAFVQNVTPVMAKGLGLAVQRGVVLADVEPEGPAERAGLKRKDVILSLNGSEVDTARRFDADINRRQGGEKIELLVQRGDERLPIGVVVEEQAAPWDPLADMVSPEKNLISRLGILCIEIDQRVQQLLPDLRGLYGLIVAAKSPDGQAQFIDLQPGDVIHAVNNLPVAWLAVFQKMIDEFHRGEAVVLQIERDGRFQFVAFEIE